MRKIFADNATLDTVLPASPNPGAAGGGGAPPTGAGPAGGDGAAQAADPVRAALANKFVCPFCGSVNENEQGACPRCTMENTAASRKATKTRIGPWYVLQTRNPAAPGMKWETLLSFVRKGRVKPQSVVRGPTTHQLWRFAAQVKGLSREFGVCYSCGTAIPTDASLCQQCNRLQDPPANPDVLLEGMEPAAPVPAPAAVPADAPKEPSLEAADADFVIPVLGGSGAATTTGMGDSLAGFAMSDSLSGVVITQDWARIDPASRNGPRGGPPSRDPAAPAARDAARPAPARDVGARDAGPTRREPSRPVGRDPQAPAAPPAGGPRRPGARDTVSPAATPRESAAAAAAARDAANGKKRDAEGFLSARDLAAAFKLELADGPDGDEPRAAPRPGPAAGPSSPAGTAGPTKASPKAPTYAAGPAFALPPDVADMDADALFNPTRGRRKGRGLKIAATLLLLAGGMFGVAFAVSESVRQRSIDWFNQLKSAWSEGQAPAPGAPKPPAGQPPTPAKPSGAGTGGAARPAPAAPSASRGAATLPSRAAGTDPKPTVTPTPAVAARPPTGGAPTVPPPAAPLSADPSEQRAGDQDAGPSAARVPAGTGGRGPLPSAPVDLAAAEKMVRQLYADAIRAEGRGDLATAVAKYEAAMTYPAEVWHSDLQFRLSEARKRLGDQR